MSKKSLILVVILILLLAGGTYFLLKKTKQVAAPMKSTSTNTTTPTPAIQTPANTAAPIDAKANQNQPVAVPQGDVSITGKLTAIKDKTVVVEDKDGKSVEITIIREGMGDKKVSEVLPSLKEGTNITIEYDTATKSAIKISPVAQASAQ